MWSKHHLQDLIGGKGKTHLNLNTSKSVATRANRDKNIPTKKDRKLAWKKNLRPFIVNFK